MSSRSHKRAVVTGISVVAPGGLGTERYWKSLLTGENGIGELSRFDASRYPSRLAGQITDFDASEHLPGRLLPQTDISTRYALTAADWALADAGVGPDSGFEDYDLGVVTSTAQGGFDFTHREFHKLWSQGPEYVSVYESFAWFYAVNTGQISIRNAMRGPSAALVGEQAGGLDAIGHARRTVRRGTRLVLSGGVDSALDPWGFTSQLAGGLVSTVTDPERAYLPFDADASGHVPGEGGAVLIVEDADSARERRAERIYGEIAGYAATFDPAPGTGRPPALGRAAHLALAEAGLTPSDVSVVFADGAGVPELDRAEADALVRLFGPRGVPVTAPKALTGRLCAGGGPVDVAAALLALRDQVIPASGRTARVPDTYGIDLVTGEPRTAALDTALVLARGRHGFNSAVVLTTPRP
ncbi:ketosynthase chain-length factor [Streptomyces sp. SID486]|uniref:beta-ketoacyl synthase N-terminal-like domain-containing protein n=1 Tax=unclassified Streptomyces TaxID=2593676 RepID=UPI001370078D|nr:ketosynthase chain-length factor [Streptomyces sp. SID2955]MYW42210.1 ketosynthase chain-length factor [Streptomyces sp. SID161]MYX96185.1 ketosynthase chain-length factor [Streptomyces sp. SID486]MYX97274.1 ketosynthase chain-length factor [Streptomyces sp. SID486]